MLAKLIADKIPNLGVTINMANYFLPDNTKLESKGLKAGEYTFSYWPKECLTPNDYIYLSDFGFDSGDIPEATVYIKANRNHGTWGNELLSVPYLSNNEALPIIANSKCAPNPFNYHSEYPSGYCAYFPHIDDELFRTKLTSNGKITLLGNPGTVSSRKYLNDSRDYEGEYHPREVATSMSYKKYCIYYKIESEQKKLIYDVYTDGTATASPNSSISGSLNIQSPYIFLYIQAPGGASGVSGFEKYSIYEDKRNGSIRTSAHGGGGGSGAFASLSINLSKFSEESPLVIETSDYITGPHIAGDRNINIYAGTTHILSLEKGKNGEGYTRHAKYSNYTYVKPGCGAAGGSVDIKKSYLEDTFCVIDTIQGARGGDGGIYTSKSLSNGNGTYTYTDLQSKAGTDAEQLRTKKLKLFVDSDACCYVSTSDSTLMTSGNFRHDFDESSYSSTYSALGGCSIMSNCCDRDGGPKATIGYGAASYAAQDSNVDSTTYGLPSDGGVWVCYT